MTTNKVLVYFGKRGGGLQLLIDTIKDLQIQNIEFSVLLSNEATEMVSQVLTYPVLTKSVFVPHSFKSILDLRNIFKTLKSLLVICKFGFVRRNSDFIQLMPSPIDQFLDFALTFSRDNRNIRCIHDARPHPGEKWPTKRGITKRIKSADLLVFFSTEVRNQVRTTKPSFVCSLPMTFVPSESIDSELEDKVDILLKSGKPTLVLLGRIREYKGFSFFLSLNQTVIERFNFLVAGEGKIGVPVPSNVHVINRWLTDAEYLKIVEKFEVFILPYSEASQSGLIPLLINLNKTIIVSDKAGLAEQIQGYKKSSQFSLQRPEEINSVIMASIELEASLERNSTESTTVTLKKLANILEFSL